MLEILLRLSGPKKFTGFKKTQTTSGLPVLTGACFPKITHAMSTPVLFILDGVSLGEITIVRIWLDPTKTIQFRKVLTLVLEDISLLVLEDISLLVLEGISLSVLEDKLLVFQATLKFEEK